MGTRGGVLHVLIQVSIWGRVCKKGLGGCGGPVRSPCERVVLFSVELQRNWWTNQGSGHNGKVRVWHGSCYW